MSRVRAHRRSLIPLVAVLLTGCLGSGGSQSVSSKGIEKINHLKDGAVTPEGQAVNTVYTANLPHPGSADSQTLLPNQSWPTIGDRLSGKNLDWAWYSGGWNDALAGKADPLFQFHHQPFATSLTTRTESRPSSST